MWLKQFIKISLHIWFNSSDKSSFISSFFSSLIFSKKIYFSSDSSLFSEFFSFFNDIFSSSFESDFSFFIFNNSGKACSNKKSKKFLLFFCSLNKICSFISSFEDICRFNNCINDKNNLLLYVESDMFFVINSYIFNADSFIMLLFFSTEFNSCKWLYKSKNELSGTNWFLSFFDSALFSEFIKLSNKLFTNFDKNSI